jgi:galactokinase
MSGPTVTFAAPGRINLIGEHTDYNQGFALPIALPERTVVTYTPTGQDTLTVASDREDGAVVVPLDTAPGGVTGWAAYVAGVVWALREAGHPVHGGRMSVTSEVEMGSGLSSSAALECAVLGALTSGLDIDLVSQATLAQHAENDYVGAPTGVMDQLASLCGERRRALLIDFRDLRVEPVDFDPDSSGVALLVFNSHAPHQHAGGEYAARRASCERAAQRLHVSSLRDVQSRGVAALEALTDDTDIRRARHILTENDRVAEFVGAIADGDFSAAGLVLTASHVSMRDDFEITTPHLDLIAETAVRAGGLGARMTGGGFGGSVIALTPADRVDEVGRTVHRVVTEAGYPEPTVRRTQAGAGAQRL